MSTVSDIITWATHETGLRAYPGIPATGEAANLELWLVAATGLCDDYIERDDYVATVPSEVTVGVYELVKHMLLNAPKSLTATGLKTAQLQEMASVTLRQTAAWQLVADQYWAGQSSERLLKA